MNRGSILTAGIVAVLLAWAPAPWAQPLPSCTAVTDDEAQAFEQRYLVYTVDPSGQHDMVELYEESNGVSGRQEEQCVAPDGSEVDADERDTAAIFLRAD